MNKTFNRQMTRSLAFVGWLLFAVGIGLLVGVVGVAFHHGVEIATEWRDHYPNLIFFLPLGGLSIILLYQVCGMEKDRGTNLVLESVRENQPMKLRTAPLIFISTVITHLVGGSSGREGAALQLGASISSSIAHKLGLADEKGKTLTICGMAAAFSAIFGTPLAAAVFALEVVHVGVLHYSLLVPALVSSLTGFLVAGWMGNVPTVYTVFDIAPLSFLSIVQVLVLGSICALFAHLFCLVMHTSHSLYQKYLPDPRWRAMVGGLIVVVLSILSGGLADQTYNGAGTSLIQDSINGGIGMDPLAFLWKIIFTAFTLGAGFRGGEIVPTFAWGATLGCVVAPFLGLSASFGASLGMTAAFCGVTNCPLASLLLAYELFGGQSLPLFALCIAMSYRLSGYSSLYSSQQFVNSKSAPKPYEKKGI